MKKYEQALDFLLILNRKQGFICFDDFEFISNKLNLEIIEVDNLSKKLTFLGHKLVKASTDIELQRVNKESIYKHYYENFEEKLNYYKDLPNMNENENFNFHQTFQPEPEYISSILNLARDEEVLTVKEISTVTGIPTGESSGKVEPHILYASFMGLINYEKKDGKYQLSQTRLGNCVYHEDRGLQETLTILLCHTMLNRRKLGAYLWSFIFHDIFPYYEEGLTFSKLLSILDSKFTGKVNTKNFAPFKASYENIFNRLDLIQKDSDSNEAIITLKAQRYNSEFIYLYAYVLYEYWDLLFANQDEITSEQIETIGFRHPFGWSKEDEYKVLEHLAEKGIIRMNRQLIPYTVVKLKQKNDLIEKLYSELC